ncbi:GTP-binding protein [Aquifex sp.]
MILDHIKKQVKFKIVYHGPALAGKTTNVLKIAENRGEEILSFNTKTERTLVFDMVKEEREVKGFKATFIIYTIPGQDIYSDIRKMVMRGADGVVYVADSSDEKLEENKRFWNVLSEDLKLYGKDIEDTPIVIQYNKRDLSNALPLEELNREVNILGKPFTEAVAVENKGVEETLNLIIDEVLKSFGKLLK